MPAHRLHTIRLLFAVDDSEKSRALAGLVSLLEGIPGAQPGPLRVRLGAEERLPVVEIAPSNDGAVQVVFDGAAPFQVVAAGFPLGSRPFEAGVGALPDVPAWQHRDLVHRFAGHLRGLDHAGVDLPRAYLPEPAWQVMKEALASSCNLYAYPDGQEWPFIVPADSSEFAGQITTFDTVREPLFELAYDAYRDALGIHFHLLTDLSSSEVAALLPEPYGFTLPGVETFRSVYVAHPWSGLSLRFDLGPADPTFPNSWDTGEWLVKEGGWISGGID